MPASPSPLWKVALFATIVLLVAGIPVVVTSELIGADFALAAIAGSVVGLMGVLMLRDPRAACLAVGAMAASATVTVLASPWPVAGAIWLGLVGAGVGIAGLRGWSRIATMITIWNAYLLVTPPQVGTAGMFQGDAIDFSVRASWETALIVIVSGAFMVLATPLLFRGRTPMPAETPLAPSTAWTLAVCLGLLLLLESLLALTSYRVPAAHWLLLTTLVLVQPTKATTFRRGVHRAIGTLAGAVIAGAIVLVGVPHELRGIVGFALLIAALTIMTTPRPYWLYATILTPGVILLSAGSANALDVTAARVGFTLLGVALALGVVALLSVVERGRGAAGSRPA